MTLQTLQESASAWKEAAENSKQPRFPWKHHLGVSLRHYAYSKAEEDWKQSSVCSEVKTILWSKGIAVTPYLANCIKIGVSAAYTEYRSLRRVETMEEKIEEPKESEGFTVGTEKIAWTDLGTGERKEGIYFRPEVGKSYKLVFKHAEPRLDHKFKDKNGNPKKKIHTVLQSINGEPGKDLIWETASYDIINPIKKAVLAGKLDRIEWLLKAVDDRGVRKYIFEEIGDSSPSPPSSDGVEALL